MPQPYGIGVDISEDQIRAVRLRRTPHGPMLLGVGSAPTPEGAMSGASVMDPRLLSDGIRRALRLAGISSGLAVAGLPGRAAASRVLELPSMAKDEMKSVIAGEMEHYRMIPMDQGTFDFLPLSEAEEESRRMKVLVMAADKKMVDQYREALRLAGVQLAALEPVALAASRAVYPALEHGGVAFITIGARSSELTVFVEGALRYSRQIDVGLLDLLQHAPAEGTLDVTTLPPIEHAPVTGIPTLERSGGDLQTLTFELQRSLDFYHRDAPDAARATRILLAVDASRITGLEAHLQGSLGMPVTICTPFADLGGVGATAVGAAAPAFAAALGLAHRMIEETPRAPRVDLSITGRESHLAKVAPRWMVWATAISLFLVIGALIALWQMHQAVRAHETQLSEEKARLVKVSEEEQQYTNAAKRVKDAQAIIQLRGLPWSEILLHISDSMPNGVWLTSIGTDGGNNLVLDGIALSANSVADLMNKLIESPLFFNPVMQTLQRQIIADRNLTRFQVRAELVPKLYAKNTTTTTPSATLTTNTAGGAQ